MIAANNVGIDITMSPTKEAGFRCRRISCFEARLAEPPEPPTKASPLDPLRVNPVLALLGCYVTSRPAYISSHKYITTVHA